MTPLARAMASALADSGAPLHDSLTCATAIVSAGFRMSDINENTDQAAQQPRAEIMARAARIRIGEN